MWHIKLDDCKLNWLPTTVNKLANHKISLHPLTNNNSNWSQTCPYCTHLPTLPNTSTTLFPAGDNQNHTNQHNAERKESFWTKKLSHWQKIKFDPGSRVIGEYWSQIDSILRVNLSKLTRYWESICRNWLSQ